MSLYVKNRRLYKRSVRTWFSCDRCEMWGDCTTSTVEEADALLELMNKRHIACVDELVADLQTEVA